MRVNILSAGPSLAKTWDNDRSHSLAVNSAIATVQCDDLVAGDRTTCCRMQDLGAFPKYRLWTIDDEVKKIKEMEEWKHLEIISFQHLPGICSLPEVSESMGLPKRPWNWSIQGAIAVAAHLGANEIHIYGCDMKGTTDTAGYGGEYRCEDRWRRETIDLSVSIAWAGMQGIAVIQHTTSGATRLA
jgi:hypothetical protein